MNERQEAERFAALLDAHAAGSREGVGHLVAVAQRVGVLGQAMPAALPDCAPRPDFRDSLRAMLVAETAQLAAGPAATAEKQRSKTRVPAQRGTRSGARHSGDSRGVFSAAWRRRLLAAGVGVAVATGSVGGIAIASAGAEPGDPLYNAKKIFESLQLSLSGSPTDQGRDYLHLADIRLGEIDSLLRRPDVDIAGSPTQAYLDQTLGELRTVISSGGGLLVEQVRSNDDQTALHALADFLLTERQRVADLSWRLPPDLQSQPPQIVALMDQLSRQLQQAAQQAARNQQATQGSGVGQPGPGAQGQGGQGDGSQASTNTPNPQSSGDASGGTTGPGAGLSSMPSSSRTGGPSAGPSGPATIGVNLPIPVLPSIGVTLPGLLGLPGIDLGLGGNGENDQNPGATPTQ